MAAKPAECGGGVPGGVVSIPLSSIIFPQVRCTMSKDAGTSNTVTAIHVSKAGWILYAVAKDSMMNRKGIVTARPGEGLQLTDKL